MKPIEVEVDGRTWTLRQRYFVIGAPGWPSGIAPTPQTLENAQRFAAEHGGTVRIQLASAWEDAE